MIEVRKPGAYMEYCIYDGETQLCTVALVMTKVRSGKNSWAGPDWPATKARAEAIANALRHYQQSQEGERVL